MENMTFYYAVEVTNKDIYHSINWKRLETYCGLHLNQKLLLYKNPFDIPESDNGLYFCDTCAKKIGEDQEISQA